MVSAKTKSRLRKLLRFEIDDDAYEGLFFSSSDRQRLDRYEAALGAEVLGHLIAAGLPTLQRPLPELSDRRALADLIAQLATVEVLAPLSEAAEREINTFLRWGHQKGHHPERLRIAALRIRAPFHLGRWSNGVEPSWPELESGGDELKIVRLGIRREKLLLRRAPVFQQSPRPGPTST